MPVASSSRRGRRLRREPSDVIEEDGPSQVQAALTEDIVEEDEEQEEHPRQVAVRGNGTRRVQREAEVEEQAEEDNELDLNPLADFGEQPLDKAQATRIGGIASDWNSIRTQIHGNSYALVRDVAASIAEFTDGEKGDKALLGIEDMMKGLVDTEHELLVHEETLNELHQKVARGESIIYITSLYEETVQRRIAEYRKKTTRQKYVKNDEYASFKQAIFEVQHPDTAMPPVSDFIPKEDGDDSDEDEDIQVGGVMQDYKCPLSLTILVDPLTSKTCGHSFSASAIQDYLGFKRMKCPTAGCNKEIALNDLKPNKELAKKAKDAARRERMRDNDDDDDDDEVVE